MTYVTLRIALDPHHWRAQDKAGWALSLIGMAQVAAPQILHTERYEIGDTLVTVHMWSEEPPKRIAKILRDHESFRRLRTRIADLGARADFDIEGEAAA
jgi:hypothetical protein